MKHSLLIIIYFILFASCSKEVAVKNVSFDVRVEPITYKVNDTVTFNFSGDSPDIISFYSGEDRSNYEFLDKDRLVDAISTLSFSSAKFSGNNPNCASLFYSKDFNGNYDEASYRAATWVNISDRFNIPPINGTGPTLELSGEANISDLFENPADPIYFAWYYTIDATSQRTRFRVDNFAVKATVPNEPDLSTVHYDFVSCDFQVVKASSFDGIAENSGPRMFPTYILFDGPFNNTVFREAWAITAPIYEPGKANIGPAIPVILKSFNSPQVSDYKHVFKNPGTYVVTFVAQNTNIYDSKKTVKQIEIVILNN